jgi:hypothetical protein
MAQEVQTADCSGRSSQAITIALIGQLQRNLEVKAERADRYGRGHQVGNFKRWSAPAGGQVYDSHPREGASRQFGRRQP